MRLTLKHDFKTSCNIFAIFILQNNASEATISQEIVSPDVITWCFLKDVHTTKFIYIDG